MENINYDEYLATIGKIESESIDRIKNYLEEQCKEDEALKTLYRPEKIKDCWKFIFECARKISKGNNACLEYGLVYKMARDYFIEVLPKVAENPPEVKTETKAETKVDAEVQNEAAETEAEAEIVEEETEPDDVVRDEYGFEIYGEEAPKPEEKEEEPVHQEINDSLLAGCKFDAGKIIDAKAQKLSFADFFRGLHFVHADRESSILDMVVCEVTEVTTGRVSYRANESQFFEERKDEIESDTVPINGNFYSIPEDAKVIGVLEGHKRKIFEDTEEVSQQVEADVASDNVKRSECGFEVFGEDEEQEEAEKAAPEPCHQDEADVFFSGQAFNAGDIIDRHGRRLYFSDLKVGMRFVLENKLNEDSYMVGVVKKVLDNGIMYDSYRGYQKAYKRYIDDEFPCIDNEPGGWCFAVPKNAMILGWQKEGCGEMYIEPRAPVTDYDSEGNGLLFGF